MIKKQLEKEIKKLAEETLGLSNMEIVLDHPANEGFGDFTTSIALKVSKELKQSPKDVASKLIDTFYKSGELKDLGVTKIELAGPGFINFYLSHEVLITEVRNILSKKESYGTQDLLKGKKIMIEFADPNPFKEFHIGHLRNISYGESLARLQKALGANVWPVNYQGDVGLQVAKSLWGLKKLGYDKVKLENSGLNLQDKIKILGQAYVVGSKAYDDNEADKNEIVAMNVAIYKQDSIQGELLDLWRAGRAWSLEYFEAIYKRVGTTYQRYYFESEVAGKGRQLVLDHLEDGIFEKSEGAVVFNGEKYGLHTRVFVSKEDYATYEAKDMYLAPLKYSEFPYDLSLILTGNEQGEYFKVVLTALSKVRPELAAKTRNITFGMVNLKGEKMTSRKGNVITAVSIIEDAKQQIQQLFNLSHLSNLGDLEAKEIAEKVAVGAVKYSLLKSDAKNDIAFDLKESVALEGNSGPYLQYTYARARSLLRKSQSSNHKIQTNSKIQNSNSSLESGAWNLGFACDLDLGTWNFTPEELSLLHILYKFPETVEVAALGHSPHLLCNFLFDLAQKFNQFYNNVPILKDKSQILSTRSQTNNNNKIPKGSGVSGLGFGIWDFRLELVAAVAQVLKNGLYLLGIETPERM